MLKTPVNMWPFTVIHPPYTPDKQRVMRLLMTTFDYSQMQVFKRVVWLGILIVGLWLVGTKRISLARLRRASGAFTQAYAKL